MSADKDIILAQGQRIAVLEASLVVNESNLFALRHRLERLRQTNLLLEEALQEKTMAAGTISAGEPNA